MFSLNPAILVTMYVKIASNSMSTKIFDKYIMKIYSIIPTNSIAMNIFISFPDKMFNTSVLSILLYCMPQKWFDMNILQFL